MYCMNCGKKVPDNYKFCIKCGKPVGGNNNTPKTVNEQTENVDQAKAETRASYQERPKTAEPQKKKGKYLVIAIIALLAIFITLLLTRVPFGKSGRGGKSFNSPEALKEYLDSQPANTPDKPIKVSIPVDDNMFEKVAAIIMSTDKFVSLNLPGNALTIIPRAAFFDWENFKFCEKLISISIPNGVISIENHAFYECKSLTSVILPDSVINIGNNAFEYCDKLTSINIPNGITSVGERAFNGTAWLNNQPDGIIYLGKVAYGYRGKSLANTNITLLEGTKEIADGAFSHCGLTRIIIPDSVTRIGREAFYYCSYLNSVTIGNSVTSIEYGVFYECTSLKNVTIGNSVTRIGESAFSRCRNLTSIIIPNNVISIGESAFQDCYSLTNVIIPDSVISIEERVFSNCNLTSVTIPGNVTSIGVFAFYCGSLTSVTFQGSMTSIDYSSFEGDLLDKYLAGGRGTYTKTTPGDIYSKWTKK